MQVNECKWRSGWQESEVGRITHLRGKKYAFGFFAVGINYFKIMWKTWGLVGMTGEWIINARLLDDNQTRGKMADLGSYHGWVPIPSLFAFASYETGGEFII